MTRLRSIATISFAAIVAALPATGCETTAPPTQAAPDASLPATPEPASPIAATPPPTIAPPPRTSPRPVVMSTGVPATVACEVPADRTLRLTELDGTMAYGYDAELTRYSEADDEGGPDNPPRYLAACDLATGVVTRLESPVGTQVFIADFDRGRLLLNGYGEHPFPDPWLLDVATGQATPLNDFDDRAVFPVAIDDYEVVGEQILETFEWQMQPTMLDLRPGGLEFRVLTSYQIGVPAQRLRPVDIENRIVVGVVSDASQPDLPSVWIYELDGGDGGGQALAAEAFRGQVGTVTGFDGRTIVGYGVRRSNGPAQPFAWTLGDADVTWLPLPDERKGGIAWDIDAGRAVGQTFGDLERGDFLLEWPRERRGIVWDLASGEFLDLGTGPPELSGTLATEASLSPQSLAVTLQGDRVLGFLGEGCPEIGGDFPFYCSVAGFGGTSVVWDISEWLASIAP